MMKLNKLVLIFFSPPLFLSLFACGGGVHSYQVFGVFLFKRVVGVGSNFCKENQSLSQSLDKKIR